MQLIPIGEIGIARIAAEDGIAGVGHNERLQRFGMKQMGSKISPTDIRPQVGLQGRKVGVNGIVGLHQPGGPIWRGTHATKVGLNLATGFIEGRDAGIQSAGDVEGTQIQGEAYQGVLKGVGDEFIGGVAHLLAHPRGDLPCRVARVDLGGEKGLQQRDVHLPAGVSQARLLVHRGEGHGFGELGMAEAKGAGGEFRQDAGIEAGVVVVARIGTGECTQVGGNAPRVLLQHMVLVEVFIGQLGDFKQLLSGKGLVITIVSGILGEIGLNLRQDIVVGCDKDLMHCRETNIFIQAPISAHSVLIQPRGILQITVGFEGIAASRLGRAFPVTGQIDQKR